RQNNPHTLIRTSGLDVGLPDGQMGNSEVGHTNIGAGRDQGWSRPRGSAALRQCPRRRAERRFSQWESDWTSCTSLPIQSQAAGPGSLVQRAGGDDSGWPALRA
ncbi:MAG TPA: hypothetical protein GYA10_17590, partial [Alphaproteobacteria bacterium]|nr:hypothetical protein [Alphaproteobacteria bacterium]